jgi:hypothetical protein
MKIKINLYQAMMMILKKLTSVIQAKHLFNKNIEVPGINGIGDFYYT